MRKFHQCCAHPNFRAAEKRTGGSPTETLATQASPKANFNVLEHLLTGCTTQDSGNPQPNECNVCRVAKDAATGNCLPECEEPNYLTPAKFCVDQSCKSLYGHVCQNQKLEKLNFVMIIKANKFDKASANVPTTTVCSCLHTQRHGSLASLL